MNSAGGSKVWMHVKQSKDGVPLLSPLCCTHGLFLAGETEPTRSPSIPRTWMQINILTEFYFYQISLPPFLPGHVGWGSIFALVVTEERSGCLWVRTMVGEAGKEAAGPYRGSESLNVGMLTCESPLHCSCWRPESKSQYFLGYLFFNNSAPWIHIHLISWNHYKGKFIVH